MISSEYAILKARRGLTFGAILRWAMIMAAAIAVLVEPVLDGTGYSALGVLLVVAAAWLVLSFRSVRGSRMAAESPMLIAAGQFELAEQQIAESLDTFSIFRTVKLMSLHHLALLRHAQNRWQDSALLCRALLTQRLGRTGGMGRANRLILAESLLELGDLTGAYESMIRLYEQHLTLREALNLMAMQTDYLARIGAWQQMMSQVMAKVEMSELLPPLQASRTQALLALAALKTGRREWCDWLRKRVELLADVQSLCANRPMLSEVWS